MAEQFEIIESKGNMRRFRRSMQAFDPRAEDGDGDGLVQEGTPFQRPAKPNFRVRRGENPESPPRRASFWDYRKPQQLDPLPELDEPDEPVKPKPWREVQLKPERGEIPIDTEVIEVRSDKVTRDQWYAFNDAVLERMMELRDSDESTKDERRGIAKLYGSLRKAKIKKNEDGTLSVSLTNTERARIIKGIQSMKKKKYDIPNMDIVKDMLEAIEKKSHFAYLSSDTSRPFSGIRYKSTSFSRTYVSAIPDEDVLRNIRGRDAGFRIKGDVPLRKVDYKALGTSIGGGAGRRTGRLVTERFDPNAEDGDGDGLVQEGSAFERPAVPKKPSIVGTQKPQNPIKESIPKAKQKNSVMKAQADRKAMNFQIEKLRSTLRRVGSDYAPSWWDTKSNSEFSKKLGAASPEELSELFARIYVERRSLMTSKVGRMPNGTLAVYADTPNDAAKKRDAMLKLRGEQVYKEMVGRILGSGDASDSKKRGKQFADWYKSAAENADWYFEQSFKITKRKKRRKLGVDAPVNRRGTRWAEDPNFPEDSFDKVIESIETDLRRANPSISSEASRRRAEQIVRDADKRIGRTPDKTPRAGGENRQIIDPNKPPLRRTRMNLAPRKRTDLTVTRKNKYWYPSRHAVAPNIKNVDSDKAVKMMNDAIAANIKRFGQLESFDEFKNAFKTLSPDIKIDMFRNRNMSDKASPSEQAIMHSFLFTFQNHPEILTAPVRINALSASEVREGVGGSHGLDANLTNPAKPFITHRFSYAKPEDIAQFRFDTGADQITRKSLGLPESFGLMDGVSNQVVKDFLSKNITPSSTQQELDDIIERADALEQFVTNLHEGGHAAQAIAEMRDKWGQSPNLTQVRTLIQQDLDNMDEPTYARAARGAMYDLMKHEMTQPLADRPDVFDDMMQASMYFGADWDAIYKSFQRNGNINSAVAPYPPQIKQQLIAVWNSKPIEAFAFFAAYQQWQKMGRKKYDENGMVPIIRRLQTDPNLQVALNGMRMLDVPIQANNDKFDIAQLRNSAAGANNYLGFNDWMIKVAVKRMAHKDFSYDSLSDSDKKIALDAMEKLSDYAARTSRYGASYGRDSNVEGIAELVAAYNSGVIASRQFSAEEMRVLQLLMDWMTR
jgi:hypothetical protein